MPSQIDLTLGAVEIGALISCMLYGAVTVQLYIYSGRCKNDPRWLITLVVAVWLLETFYTILSICYLYDVTISNFGNPVKISSAPWTLDISVTIQGTIGTIVQSFFAFRVWKFSRSLFWPSIAWVGGAARLALALTITIINLQTKNIVVFSEKDNWVVVASLVVSLSVDILNVSSLTWYLTGRKSEFVQTSRMIDKVIIYSIETGLVTSITAVCMLSTRLSMPNNYVWIGLLQIYARLYSNSLMVSLNARAGFKEKFMTKEVSMSSSGAINGTTGPRRMDRTGGISIQMVSFTETGDPGQNLNKEVEDLDSAHTELDIPFKS